MLSIFEKKTRQIMISKCYEQVEDDETQQMGCEMLEQDLLDMLW